jgi:hypothetical protein
VREIHKETGEVLAMMNVKAGHSPRDKKRRMKRRLWEEEEE